MSIVDLESNSIPIDLRVKIEHVMHDENLSWKDALVFLASKVVSPIGALRNRSAFFRARGGFTYPSRNRSVVAPSGALCRLARKPAEARPPQQRSGAEQQEK